MIGIILLGIFTALTTWFFLLIENTQLWFVPSILYFLLCISAIYEYSNQHHHKQTVIEYINKHTNSLLGSIIIICSCLLAQQFGISLSIITIGIMVISSIIYYIYQTEKTTTTIIHTSYLIAMIYIIANILYYETNPFEFIYIIIIASTLLHTAAHIFLTPHGTHLKQSTTIAIHLTIIATILRYIPDIYLSSLITLMYCSLIYTVVFFIKHNHQETDITNHSDDITAEKILKGQKVLDSYQQKQKNLTQKQRHKTLYTYIYQGKTYQQWMSISEVAIMISIIVSFFLAREEGITPTTRHIIGYASAIILFAYNTILLKKIQRFSRFHQWATFSIIHSAFFIGILIIGNNTVIDLAIIFVGWTLLHAIIINYTPRLLSQYNNFSTQTYTYRSINNIIAGLVTTWFLIQLPFTNPIKATLIIIFLSMHILLAHNTLTNINE